MFVRPSRQGHAGVPAPDGTDIEHRLLINEMNTYYRLGDGAWHAFKEDNGSDGFDPILLIKMLSPTARPDVVALSCVRLYNGRYLAEHCCAPEHC